MRTWFKALLAGVVLLGGLSGFLWQWQSAANYRKAVASLRQARIDLPVENARLKKIVATGNQTEAARQVRAEIEKTRREIAGLERSLRQLSMPPPIAATDNHFTANRDPEKGPVRLEEFRDMGRATPSAAFQTAIWAMIKGEDDVLAPLFAVSPAGREKLEAILAGMTPEIRARYNPPEKLIGMLFARQFLDEEGFEIAGASEPNASGQVMLRVQRVRNGRKNALEKKFPFQPGFGGWQFPITDQMIDDIPGALEQASMYVPPRTGKGAAKP